MENIKIQFKPQIKDYRKAIKLYYSKSIFTKIDKIVGILLIGYGIFLLVLCSFVWWYLLFILFGILEIFNLLHIEPLIIRLRFYQDPKMKEEYTLEFSESGIVFKTPTIDSKLAWTHYHKLMENDDIFLLIYGRKMYSVIPKNAFKDAEEITRFRQLVNMMLSKGEETK